MSIHKDSSFLIKFVCIQYPCLVDMKCIRSNQWHSITQNELNMIKCNFKNIKISL
ncbi:hypothetical protein I3300191I4_20530 [Megasphaera elsdenii]